MQAHEAVITIARIEAVQPNRKTHKVYDTEGGEWSLFPADRLYYEEGAKYKVGFSTNDFKGKLYRTLKGTPSVVANAPVIRPGAATFITAKAADVGPHVAMWEKLASELLVEGMAESDIIAHGVKARSLALAILEAKLNDSSFVQPDDPNDSLEF